MFRESERNRQDTMFDLSMTMSKGTAEKLSKSWAPLFYENVFTKIDEKPFAVLYGKKGRPNYPISKLLSLEYIKHMNGISDEKLLEGLSFDYLVNHAIGHRVLGESPMADRTLYNFRARVYEYSATHPEEDDILFGQFMRLVRDFAEKSGVSLDKQRMDTTLFVSNIKKSGRLALAYDVLELAAKAVPESILSEGLREALRPAFRTDLLFRLKREESEGKLDALLALIDETARLLDGVGGADKERRIALRFLEEQSEPDGEGGIRARDSHEISADSLQSAYDEDATYHKKGGVGRSGFSLEVSETCDRENPYQLLTDHHTEKNNVSDVHIMKDRIGLIAENTGCEDMYTDGGFNSPDVEAACAAAGVTQHLSNMTGTSPTKKLPADAYEIGDASLIVKCPQGHAPAKSAVTRDQSVAHFDKDVCAGCPKLGECHATLQKKHAVVRLQLKSIRACRERSRMVDERAENTSMRAAIEGSNSAIKRKGLGRMRVRGLARCAVVSGLLAAAQNIKRFINFKLGKYDRAIRIRQARSLPECT